MSRTIENRIVSMGFDNANFEKNVGQTLGSLDKLRDSLNFNDTSRSMAELERSARGVDLSPLSESIVTVTDNFSMLETIAFSVLNNITNKAVDAGLRFAKSLTLDQVTSGFSKYESQVNSVQTILNAVEGSTIDQVTEKVDKLQWFADETSYSLADMLSNVSKFTANEIGLEDAVSAMTGIANWAAVSGQNAQSASRAMYNLSQAIGVGALKLQDWKSIQNANMGTAEFKKTAMEIAANLDDEHKTLEYIGDGIYQTLNGQEVTIKTFDQTLSDAWLSKDVLMATLQKYSEYSDALYEKVQEFDAQGISITVKDAAKYLEEEGRTFGELGKKAFKAAQQAKTFNEAIDATKDAISSSFSRMFNNIFGNYEEAVKMWSGFTEILYDTFVAPFDEISSIIAQWHKLSYDSLFGFDEDTETYGAFFNFFYNLSDLLKPLRHAWEAIFPKKTTLEIAEILKKVTDRFSDFVDKMVWSNKATLYLTRAFRGLFSVFSLIKDTAKAAYDGLYPIGELFSFLWEKVLLLAKNIGNLLSSLTNTSTISVRMFETVSAVSNAVKNSVESLVKYFEIFFAKFKENGGTIENLKKIFEGLGAAIDIFKSLVSALLNGAMQLLSPLFEKVSGSAGTLAGTMFEGAATVADYIVKLRDLLKTNNTFANAIGKIVKVIQDAINFISNAFGSITGMTFGEFFEHILDVLRDIFGYIGEFFDSLNSKTVESSTESVDKASESIGVFDAIFQGFGEILKTVFQIIKDLAPVIKDVLGIAGGILSNIGKGLVTLFQGVDTKQLAWIVKTGILVAVGLALMKFLNSLRGITKVGKGLGSAIKGVFTSISGALDAFKQKAKAESILVIAESIGILAAALLVLSTLEPEKLVLGVAAIAAMFALIGASLKVLAKIAEESKKYIPNMVKLASAMLMVAGAVAILSLSIKILSGIKIGNLIASTVAIAALCEMMVLMVKQLSKKTKGAKEGIKNIKSLALALNLLVPAILLISLIPTNNLVKAIAGVGVLLLMMTDISKRVPKPEKLAKVASGIALFGLALLTIMPSFLILSAIKPEAILKSILAIGLLLGSVGVLGTVKINPKTITKVVLAMVGVGAAAGLFAGAIALIALFDWPKIIVATTSMIAVMFAMIAFSKLAEMVGTGSLLAFVKVLAVFGAALLLIAGILEVMTVTVGLAMSAITSLLTLLSLVANGYDFSTMMEGAKNLSKIIQKVGWAMFFASVGFDTFGKAIIVLGLGLTILSKAINGIAGAVDTFVDIIDKLFDSREQIFAFSKMLGQAFMMFIAGIINSIPELAAELIRKINQAIIQILKNIDETLPTILSYLSRILTTILSWTNTMVPMIGSFIFSLVVNVLTLIDNYSDTIISLIISILVKVIDGVANKLDVIMASVMNLIVKVIDALTTAIDQNGPKILDAISKLLQSIVSLVMQFFGVDKETADSLTGSIFGSIGSIFGKLTSWGAKINADILGWCSDLFGNVEEAVNNFFNGGGWQKAWEKVSGAFTSLWEGIVTVSQKIRDAVKNAVDFIMGDLKKGIDFIREIRERITDLGMNLIRGLVEGIQKGIDSLGDKLSNTWNTVVDFAKNVFGVHSPSKVFGEIGEFLDQGLGIGIEKNTDYVTDSVREMSGDVMDQVLDKRTGIAAAIETFNESLNGEIDSEPVIRPVLDLTSIQNGSAKIAEFLNGDNALSLDRAVGMAQSISTNYATKSTTTLDSSTAILAAINGVADEIRDMNDQTFENTFNITGANPREIAQEVADIIQRQVERRTAIWA